MRDCRLTEVVRAGVQDAAADGIGECVLQVFGDRRCQERLKSAFLKIFIEFIEAGVVVLRATQKVLRSLPQSGHNPGTSDTALGDWYVNRIVIARQPLLLLVSEKSLLSILTPARDVKGLPERLAEIVATRLHRLGIDDVIVAAEIAAMSVVAVAKTADRSVTGQMVDFAKHLTYYLPQNGWSEWDLQTAEAKLAEMPCRASGPFDKVIFPQEAALRLLADAWSGHGVRH